MYPWAHKGMHYAALGEKNVAEFAMKTTQYMAEGIF